MLVLLAYSLNHRCTKEEKKRDSYRITCRSRAEFRLGGEDDWMTCNDPCTVEYCTVCTLTSSGQCARPSTVVALQGTYPARMATMALVKAPWVISTMMTGRLTLGELLVAGTLPCRVHLGLGALKRNHPVSRRLSSCRELRSFVVR